MAGDTFLDSNGKLVGMIPLPPERLESEIPTNIGGGGSGAGGFTGTVDPPLSDTFKLHSRPSATKTIFLDFDGFIARGTAWNASRGRDPIISPPYDPDRNGPSFTDNELRAIQTIWQRVSGDFSAFNVNVTTEDPGEEALVDTGGTDDRWGIRVVMTPDNFPAPGAGGVAYIGSFRWNYNRAGATDTPCYVFNSVPAEATLAATHEVGHALGLSHDGTDGTNPFQQNAAYYFGHGGSGETSWGPTMGAPYGKNVTTWDDGTFWGSNNGRSNANFGAGPDDIAIITNAFNGFGFAADEAGNSRDTSVVLTGPIGPDSRTSISLLGTIEKSTDLDFYQIQVGAGTLDLTIDPYVTRVWTKKDDGTFEESVASALFDTNRWENTQSANLDVEAKIYDASGNVIAESNPDGLRAEFKSLPLGAGIYYLSIDGIGFGSPRSNPPSGYSDYGSIGQYLISGSFPLAFGLAVSDAALTFIENENPKPITSWARVLDNFPGDYSSGSLMVSIDPIRGSSDYLTLDYSGSGELSQVGSRVLYRGTDIGSFTRTSESSLRYQFNSEATKESIEAIIRSIRFDARGDSPDTSNRSIQLTLLKGLARGTTNIQVKVISVNDRPIASVAPMEAIKEDEITAKGTKIDTIIDRGVIDVDGTRGKAIVVTAAPTSRGKWQVDLGGGWTDIGTVSATQGLVLGGGATLRFVPTKDFFGAAPPLKYYALDPTYAGGISSSMQRVYVDVGTVQAPDSISLVAGEIRQNVEPVNDPPVATIPFPTASISQDQFLNFSLRADAFVDVDDDETKLIYTAFTSSGAPLPQWLSFDPITKTFTGIPTNDDVGVRQVVVRASDSKSFGDVPVTIEVINVNDAPVSIQLSSKPVPENKFGALVGRLSAIDPDLSDTISWMIVANPMNRLEVRGNDLYLTAQSQFDFEAERSLEFTIRAKDNGTPSLFLEKILKIEVEDVNEFSPDLQPVSLSVSESALIGSEVGRIIANDQDVANKVRYRFFGSAPSQFSLSDSGILTVAPGSNLDFETKPSHQFFVEAYDDGTPSRSTWVSASVSVTNANEFAPEISTDTLVISENYPVGVPVGRVEATDRDSDPIVFSLLTTETRFEIDPATGDLTLPRSGILDFERSRTEVLTVIASDNATPKRSSQKTITITVTNANEAPTSISVERSKVPANISGYDLGRITIQDPDGPTIYSITPLDERFQVVGGNLVFKAGRSFKDSDPQFVTIPLLLNDSDGASFNGEIVLERLPNPNPWRNELAPLDVNRDGGVGPLDVLAIINALNIGLGGVLPNPRPNDSLSSNYIDADGDGQASPLDVLAIINAINNPRPQNMAEGEASTPSASVDAYFAGYDFESDPVISRTRRLARSKIN